MNQNPPPEISIAALQKIQGNLKEAGLRHGNKEKATRYNNKNRIVSG
jgi:hypothetical protein